MITSPGHEYHRYETVPYTYKKIKIKDDNSADLVSSIVNVMHTLNA